jgi:hypothetical protein
MTGPEHYRAAERRIEEAHTVQHDSGPGCGSEEILAEAQVHATLALAAATIDAAYGQMSITSESAWAATATTRENSA